MAKHNILITGGLGFIGHKTAELMQKSYNVSIVDNSTTYGTLDHRFMHWIYNQRRQKVSHCNIYNVDIAQEGLHRAFNEQAPVTVIHFASFPRQKTVAENPLIASDTMVRGLVNTLEACKQFGTKRFVFISSSMVYGNFDHTLTEDSQCNPIGLYGILKLTGENIVKDFCDKNSIEYVIIRPSAVYGPLDNNDRVIANFCMQALNKMVLEVKGKDEYCDFTFVDDVAKGIARASAHEKCTNQTYNLTAGNARKIADAAKIIVDQVGSGSIEIVEKDVTMPSRSTLSIEKAKQDFGYTPQNSLEQGLEKYIQWCKEDSVFLR
jgi:nucleoside-diphosphate-sugar epimerase